MEMMGAMVKSFNAGFKPELPGFVGINAAVNIPPLDGAEVYSICTGLNCVEVPIGNKPVVPLLAEAANHLEKFPVTMPEPYVKLPV